MADATGKVKLPAVSWLLRCDSASWAASPLAVSIARHTALVRQTGLPGNMLPSGISRRQIFFSATGVGLAASAGAC